MFQFNPQLSIQTNPLSIQDPSAANHVPQSGSPMMARHEVQNGAPFHAQTVIYEYDSKKLEEDLKALGLKIKKHEANIKILMTRGTKLEETILDLQVNFGKYHSSSSPMIEDEDHSHVESEEATVENIMKQEKSAAAILCILKARHGNQTCHLPLTKDVLGVVATLGKVDDDNLSRLLSEYLGIETMLAVVCKTYNGVKALETYEKDGSVNKSSGLHGLGTSIGRHLDGRFLVICLENLRPYVGEFIDGDPQMRLDILKPRLPSGELPPGFIGLAVNMINIDNANLFCVTADGHGLRETLFYNLFSGLQVYRTRADMIQALPCISNGAVSLDGGIVKTNGFFCLGNRGDIGVKFPKSYVRSNQPLNYVDIEKQIKEMKCEKERMTGDMEREKGLLDYTKKCFESKKQEILSVMASKSYATQQHRLQAGRDRMTPR